MHLRSPSINIKFTSVSGDQFALESAEVGGDVLSVETNKTIAEPVGTFSITLIGRKDFSILTNKIKKGKNAYEIFRPAGLVDIYINDEEIMLGMIDGITKSVSIGEDGEPLRSWIITGRDLGAFLVDNKVWYDDRIATQREYNVSILKGLSSFGNMAGLTVAELIERIVNVWLVAVMNQTNSDLHVAPFSYTDGNKVQDKFIALLDDNTSYDIKIAAGTTQEESLGITLTEKGGISKSSYNDNFAFQFSLVSLQCDLFNYIKQLSNPPFQEIFVDTGGKNIKHQLTSSVSVTLKESKVYLIYRPAPFDDKNLKNKLDSKLLGEDSENLDSLLDINDLPSHSITDEDILQKALTMGKNSIPTAYYANPTGGLGIFSADMNFISPLYDENKLRRYGYNPMQFALTSLSLDEKNTTDKGTILDVCPKFQRKAYKWYGLSDRFLTGVFKTYGFESLRIGHVLKYNRDSNDNIEDDWHEGYYYITGVNQKWVFGENFVSTITVDRGVSKKELGTSLNTTTTSLNNVTLRHG